VLHCHGCPRALPSFPTRRSSDLGVASALLPQDTLATTHRGHGHVLARGMDVTGFIKEIMGRQGGLCKGRGGSMHVADLSLGILRSEEHTSELQSRENLVCRLLLE